MLPYNGIVRLLVIKEPWKISIDLKAIGLSMSSVRTEWHSNDRSDWISEGICDLVVEENRYLLQLEHSVDHLSFPMVEANLAQRLVTSIGWRFDFNFRERTEDLIGLIDEIERGRENTDQGLAYGRMLDQAFSDSSPNN